MRETSGTGFAAPDRPSATGTGPAPTAKPALRRAQFADLDARTWHDLLRLRIDVFVVEQACPYHELDGRDVDPGTEHLWVPDSTGPAAYLRVVHDEDGNVRIGRVCTRQTTRHYGLASVLVKDVLARYPSRQIVLAAQSYLVPFYLRHGFHRCGEDFLDDGIPHVPMAREPDTPGR